MCAQEADRALAKRLQEQEHAFLLLNRQRRGYGSRLEAPCLGKLRVASNGTRTLSTFIDDVRQFLGPGIGTMSDRAVLVTEKILTRRQARVEVAARRRRLTRTTTTSPSLGACSSKKKLTIIIGLCETTTFQVSWPSAGSSTVGL